MSINANPYSSVYDDNGTDWAQVISNLAIAGVQAYGIYSGEKASTVITTGPGGTSATSSTGPAAYTTFGNMGLIIAIGIIIAIILLYRK
jgi:hypothetical protein